MGQMERAVHRHKDGRDLVNVPRDIRDAPGRHEADALHRLKRASDVGDEKLARRLRRRTVRVFFEYPDLVGLAQQS